MTIKCISWFDIKYIYFIIWVTKVWKHKFLDPTLYIHLSVWVTETKSMAMPSHAVSMLQWNKCILWANLWTLNSGSFIIVYPHLWGFWGECSTVYSPPAPPCPFFSSLQWRLACAHQCHFLFKDQSKVALRSEMTVAECSLTSCMWACF